MNNDKLLNINDNKITKNQEEEKELINKILNNQEICKYKIQDKRKELIEFNHKTQYIYNDISNNLLLKGKKIKHIKLQLTALWTELRSIKKELSIKYNIDDNRSEQINQ